jgi:phosphoribosylformylglycinamidine synthase
VTASPISLAGSRWAVELHGHRGGTLPALDLDGHARLLALVARIVGEGLVAGVHDVSEGGLGVALAEMAVAARTGCRVSLPGAAAGRPAHADLFGEGPSRLLDRAGEAGVAAVVLGRAGGDRLVVEGVLDLALDSVAEAAGRALPEALAITPA